MATNVVDDRRIRILREGETTGAASRDVVVYWMQSAQRTHHNDALEYAIQCANEANLPLAVVFCIPLEPAAETYLGASVHHYRFMIEGLRDVRDALARRSVAFTVFRAEAATVLAALDHRCRRLVFDRGYLPIQDRWTADVLASTTCPIDQVETEVVVPIDLVSDHTEVGARTIRPKIHEHLDDFIVGRRTTSLSSPSYDQDRAVVDLARTAPDISTLDVSDVDAALQTLGFDPSEHRMPWTGGTAEATARLRTFCSEVLPDYAELRNRYDLENSSSELSPFLHFGQISPVEVVRAARASNADQEHVDSFIEEVVVRRELAVNFVVHEADHGSWTGLPSWAIETLDAHRDDERDSIFTANELEAGETDDDVWNTIMKVIREKGWVHNQLRMYWGKQILRWTNNPEHAFRTLLELNNRHFLDGRDPNSYANVAWCFGRHDQGFQERPVIGKVRPFTDQALRRKGDLEGWLEANR